LVALQAGKTCRFSADPDSVPTALYVERLAAERA
jgi:hypothetical protein